MKLSEAQQDAAARLAAQIGPSLGGIDTVIVIAALTMLVKIGYSQMNGGEDHLLFETEPVN